MKSNVNSAKSAQASKAILLTGNGVSNQQNEKTSLIVLPTAPEIKIEKEIETSDKVLETVEVKKEEFQQEAVLIESPTIKRKLSIDELNDKADRAYLLRQKYQEIREKRKQLEAFTISHDKNNAQLTLVDAKGLTISTSNPVSIGKLLCDWMADLNNHLEKVESDIRIELN